MDVAAVVVAAGRGARAAGVGGEPPKQYRPLAGISVLTRALGALAAHPRIDAILTVIHPDDRAQYEAEIAPLADRLLPPVEGGATRQESVRAGLEALAGQPPRLALLHDAARPFVTPDVIDRVLAALARHDGAVPALPVAETLKRAEAARIVATVDRAGLWAAQTPQGFHYAKVLAAHRAAASAGKAAFTDDASIGEWFGLDVALVEGAAANRKLTTAEDFDEAERLLRAGAAAGEWRVGHGFDVHAFAPGNHLMLCGVRVAHERGLAGHSDADVALHALTDALLGAIGEGDIGQHFPPSDPRWRGADSALFLREAAARLAARGGRIANVDLTLICEVPRIGPHRDAMRARIAEHLAIEPARVSVKATSTEGLGFTGRREGIAAQAAIMVRFGQRLMDRERMACDIESLAEALLQGSRARGLTLTAAESCTGGLILAALTDIAGSSDVVDRGFVTYSNAAKTDMLGVPPALIERHGAVSEEVARAMVEGALARSPADLAVAVTGVAGPGGGTTDKPVGLVHIAAGRRGGQTVHVRRGFGAIGRDAVRRRSVAEALRLLASLL